MVSYLKLLESGIPEKLLQMLMALFVLLLQLGMKMKLLNPHKVWCYCGQPSYGNMITCEHNECNITWFHFDCLRIRCPPKGKWYCPSCRKQPKTSGKQIAKLCSYSFHFIFKLYIVVILLPNFINLNNIDFIIGKCKKE